MLVVTAEQLDFLRDALQDVRDQCESDEDYRDYTPEERVTFWERLESTSTATRNATKVVHLPRPTHNGEWGYRAKGEAAVRSVVFVDGVSAEDPGYVLSDLNDGQLEGKSVETLDGTWQEVWLP